MFASPAPITIDELEVDRVPTTVGDETYCGEEDDATEISQRSFVPHSVMPSSSQSALDGGGGGSIRMEGWLNHTTSSHRNQAAAAPSDGTAPPQPTSSSSSSTTSMLGKAVSKTKRGKRPRYFVLRGSALSCYVRRHDVKAKGTFVLKRGCEVGPVLYQPLDEPPSLVAAVSGQQAEAYSSPSVHAEGASVSASTATELQGNRTKKKKRRLYCVQVTWPVDNKPSKDEKFMAQAKAQVAAESENEAIIQQRQEQERQLAMQLADSQNVEYSLEDYANGQSGGNRSPKQLNPRKLIRRAKSESNNNNGSPRRKVHQQQNADSFPADLAPPDLADETDDCDHVNSDGRGHHPPRMRPSKCGGAPMALNTPASALSGTNAFHRPIVCDTERATDAGLRGSLNHETGLHKHYTQQIAKHAEDQQKTERELQKVMQLLSSRKSNRKTRKRVIQGTKVAAVSTAAITAGVLTAGIGLAAGLMFVGATAAAGGSGAVVGSKVLGEARGKYRRFQSQKSFHLIIGATTYDDALKWKMAMEQVIKELVIELNEEGGMVEGMDLEWRVNKEQDGSVESLTAATSTGIATPAPPSPKVSTPANRNAPPTPACTSLTSEEYHDLTPRWVPIQGGGVALWGILGALGGGGGSLRIYREEHSPLLQPSSPWLFSAPAASAFPKMPRFRSDVGLVGQPFPPFKASVNLRANSLDAFMCLMCNNRARVSRNLGSSQNSQVVMSTEKVPIPNSGQIASFLIIETMDDHMDVIHLAFRPLYLFPSWTAPRDFVLYRFWKFDDDGTYQICFDSGQHRDCPPVPGYVRGEMHGVYTIAPLKKKRKRAAGASAVGGAPSSSSTAASTSQPNLMNEECLMSHVVQIDPRGWVPSASSLPFLRGQGYGDAFAIMALHQMLDVKETLDSARFVAIPMEGTQDVGAGSGVQRGFRKRVRPPRPQVANWSGVGVPKSSKAPIRDTSGGSMRPSMVGGAGTQQQVYMPTLDRSASEDASEDEEHDSASYDFKYSRRELFSADGYHQTPATNHSNDENVRPNNKIIRINWPQYPENNNDSVATSPSISSVPPPMITEWWAEPDANSFRVRGKTYKSDRKKVNAGSSLFRLFAVDIVETDIPIMTGMCLHPKERVQQAMQRDREAKGKGIPSSEMPPFVFVVNIALPGPPNYHMVFYYAVNDLSTIDGSDGTPSSKLCQEFFFGKDDTFRDNTFKLIPQIIEGNFMVRKAVGSTPAIMGNKIKQTYVQGKQFFELMIDTGSSAVAAGVIRICNGYAKMIVVSLAFLFEGYNEHTLPERVLGCVMLKNVEFGKKLRFVESTDE